VFPQYFRVHTKPAIYATKSLQLLGPRPTHLTRGSASGPRWGHNSLSLRGQDNSWHHTNRRLLSASERCMYVMPCHFSSVPVMCKSVL